MVYLVEVNTLSFRELRAATFPPQHYLISHGLLPVGGLLVVGGAPKSLKSWTLNAITTGLATGQPIFGNVELDGNVLFNVTEPRRVLVLEQEIGTEDNQKRLLPSWEAMPPEHQALMDENLFIRSQDFDLRLDTDAGTAHLASLIEETKPDVLALDPLKNFWFGDENSTREMGIVVGVLLKIKAVYGIAIVIAHHTAKPSQQGNQREGAHDLRGSSVLYGAGDAFLMQRLLSRKESRVRADFTLRRYKPIPPIMMQLDENTLRMCYKGTITDDEPEQPKTKQSNNGNATIGTLIK